MSDGYVPLATYAAATGKSMWTLRRWCHEGSIDARRNGHGNWTVAQVEVDRAIAARAGQPLGRARPRAERFFMGMIRTGWGIIFPGLGFALTVVADTYSSLPIPQPWTAIGVGALAYGLKRYWWPDATV